MWACLNVVLGAACSVRGPLAPVSFLHVLCLSFLFAKPLPSPPLLPTHGETAATMSSPLEGLLLATGRRDECLGRRQPARPKFALPARPATAAAAAAPCCSGPESRHLALVGRQIGFADIWARHVCCINTSFGRALVEKRNTPLRHLKRVLKGALLPRNVVGNKMYKILRAFYFSEWPGQKG